MNLNDYFDPIDIELKVSSYIDAQEQIFSSISIHTREHKIDKIENANLAILGVVGNSANQNDSSEKGLVKIREHFYSLAKFNKPIHIYDLGNFKQCKTTNDQNIGLRDVIIELITLNIMPIIIGHVDEILYPNYIAYQKLDKNINLVNIDSKIRIQENREKEYKSALWKILVENNNSLFFYTNIGYQMHFVGSKVLKYLDDHLHFAYRLGYIRSNIKEVEPVFRDADIIGINIEAVRQSDAFGQFEGSPNGYYGEEICQLSRYAGMSSKLSSFGLYNYCINNDKNFQTAHLVAQIIWYFIDGFMNKIEEYPAEDNRNYKKLIVKLDDFDNQLIFYNSKKTNRWWLEVPYIRTKKQRKILVSCTEEDYLSATNGDVPERWLKSFQKIN
jgi:arginase family enzyme